jgi:hypothetical protein
LVAASVGLVGGLVSSVASVGLVAASVGLVGGFVSSVASVGLVAASVGLVGGFVRSVSSVGLVAASVGLVGGFVSSVASVGLVAASVGLVGGFVRSVAGGLVADVVTATHRPPLEKLGPLQMQASVLVAHCFLESWIPQFFDSSSSVLSTGGLRVGVSVPSVASVGSVQAFLHSAKRAGHALAAALSVAAAARHSTT